MNRLRELRKRKNLTQTEVANFIGISQNNYSYWENGKVKIDSESLKKLSEYFNVSVDYLLGNESSFSIPNYKNIFPLTPYVKMPILGEIRAGNPIFMEQGENSDWDFADDIYGNGEHFMLRVIGNSMAPTIPEGSIAIIHQQSQAEKGQVVVVTLDGETATLKRYFPQKDGSILFRGDNPESESYLITPAQIKNNEVKILGVLREYKVKVY